MHNYIKKKWKNCLSIGLTQELDYLEKQRIAIINVITLITAIVSILITLLYLKLEFSTPFIPLLILPSCFVTIWLNYKKKYSLARLVAFCGVYIVITFLCFFERRTGVQLLYIAIVSGGVSMLKSRKNSYFLMIICAITYFIYVYYDHSTPFVPNPTMNYFMVNTIFAYVTAGVIFIQIMSHSDISSYFSKKMELIGTEASKDLYAYQMAINDNLNSVVTNHEGEILDINDLYLENTGYKKNELVGQNISVLKSDFHDDAFYENISQTINSGRVWRGESKIKTKNGSEFWIVSSILPVKNTNNEIIKFLTISANITEQKIAQENERLANSNLLKSEKRLGLFLENQLDLVVITDKIGTRKYVNKAFCEFFGKEKEYFIGTNYRNSETENVDQTYLELFDSLSYDNPKISITYVSENAQGEKRWIKWDEIAFFDDHKNVIEILSIGHDITEIKEKEFQSAHYIAQFEELAFKNSHHFRRPLSNILGVIDLIDEDSTPSEVNEFLKIIKSEINLLDRASTELSVFINTNSINHKNYKEDFNSDFVEAKLKYLKWKYKLENLLRGSGSLTYNQAISHLDSDLGKWFFNEGKEKYGKLKPMQKFELHYKKAHEIAKQIIELLENKEISLAEEKHHEFIQISDSIVLSLDEADKLINNENAPKQ